MPFIARALADGKRLATLACKDTLDATTTAVYGRYPSDGTITISQYTDIVDYETGEWVERTMIMYRERLPYAAVIITEV